MAKCIKCFHYKNGMCLTTDTSIRDSFSRCDHACGDYIKVNGVVNKPADDGTIRKFETGATRDTSVDKLDFEGFLSPIVLKRYAEYLNEHRVQSDGKLRDSDNWQKGIPLDVYMKSKLRHLMDTWLSHRSYSDVDIEVALCAEIFNTMGMLHEILKLKRKENNA